MALESPVSTIYDLVATNPTSGDPKAQGDDHIRNMKTALLASFEGDASSTGHQTIGRVILQWGQGSPTTGGETYSFDIPFPTACLQVVASAQSTTETINAVATIVSASQVRLESSVAGTPVSYIAIGH
jgi:hypothetical protein